MSTIEGIPMKLLDRAVFWLFPHKLALPVYR
jgi:hypothetical protein